MKLFDIALVLLFMTVASFQKEEDMVLKKSFTVDSLGACQGISFQDGRLFMYGDRETGIIREYQIKNDSPVYQHHEIKLTLHDSDVINHPTGIAWHRDFPVFIGNSIRLNKEGTLWKAVIYQVDWEGLNRTGKLDGNLLNTIEDDACVQGTRPEYVEYGHQWYVATADYGSRANEVRLYDPAVLKNAKKTTDKGVLYKKFTCSPWVQNLHWIAEKGLLLLIQNQTEGKKWRFTYVDLEESIRTGKEHVVKVIDIEREDELEGFAFVSHDNQKGIAVTSSRFNNVNMINMNW